MIGAIIGDTVGSVYEFDNIKTTNFPLFEKYSEYIDDTVLTVAVADWLLNNGDLVEIFRRYGKKYPYTVGMEVCLKIGCSPKIRSHTTVGVMARRCV
jgi:ADP-ribosylglycohydrolase